LIIPVVPLEVAAESSGLDGDTAPTRSSGIFLFLFCFLNFGGMLRPQPGKYTGETHPRDLLE
jgi:hypothetical protein